MNDLTRITPSHDPARDMAVVGGDLILADTAGLPSDPHEAYPLTGPHGAGHSVLGASRQGEFLASLQLFGNVRLACRRARVSAQTAYRVRRRSAAFARAWDAALIAARAHAEATLADRAINGVEEPVFYHGEEIARRRRYSDRLLLAHLARLDRMEEREELAAMVPLLDDVIEGLREGEEIGAVIGRVEPVAEEAQEEEPEGAEENPQDSVPCVPSCRTSEDETEEPDAPSDPDDPQWLGNRLDRMDAARPRGADEPHELALNDEDVGLIEALQLEAFEAGVARWWEVLPEGYAVPGTQERSTEDGHGDDAASATQARGVS